ncbi:MAG TPA: TetR/AcrR family transcriptional regulator [Candidatus Acidoferrum sp.]|nr:TetR/AcrR family transcriptional regulator [Candidatus Acidoferrum sp.]
MAARIPIPRDSEAKLQHILRHAAQIFAERGFEGASIRDISRATGISLSGLYYYFESKQQLLYLIQKNAFTSILSRLQLRLVATAAPEERLKLFIQNHLEYFLAHPAEMKVLSHEEDALEEPYNKEIAVIKRRYYAFAREIFDDLAAREAMSELNPRIAVLSLYGMMNWVYKWHDPKVDPRSEELAGTISEIFLRGVLHGRNGARAGQDRESRPLEHFQKVGAAD